MPVVRPALSVRALIGAAVVSTVVSCTPATPPPVRSSAARDMGGGPPRATAAPSALLLAPPPVVAAGPRISVAAPPFRLDADVGRDAAARARECLTAAVYYEARSEPEDGQRAVAQVVLNRVRNPAFPASVCGVVYQRARSDSGCQFSFACDGSMLRPREADAWARAAAIADSALAGAVYAPAGAATFYHTRSIMPWWASSLARVATIGAHIFYRLGDGWRGALDFRQAYAAVEPRRGGDADEAGLAAKVRHYVLAGADVVVHHGAASIEGIVVHRGDSGPTRVAGADGGQAVRVHSGAPPAADAVADAGDAPA